MSRLLKFILIGVLLFSIGLYGLWRYCSQELATYASAKISKVAISQNVFLNFTKSSFGLFNFQSKLIDVEIANNKVPVRMEIRNFIISPVLTSLFTGEQAVDFSFEMLNGKVGGRLYRAGQAFGLKDFKVQNLGLHQVPFMKMLGFSSGSLDLDLEKVFSTGQEPEISNLKFKFKNFVKKDASVLPAMISGLPFNLNIEPLDLQELGGTIQKDSVLEIQDLNLLSDWGNVLADFVMVVDPKGLKLSVGTGEVELKDSGSKQFASFLPLISNQKLSSEQRKFSFKFLDNQGGFPRFDFTPQ